MIRPGVFCTLLAVVLAAQAGGGRALADAPAAPQWKLDNPFCNVLATFVPDPDKAAGTAYGLKLFAREGTTVEAHVTLIGKTQAFDAHVTSTNLSGDATDRTTDGALVTFDRPTPIDYFFVDSYSIDGAAPVTCPSYVFAAGAGPEETEFAGMMLPIAPSLIQDLPPLRCGHVYVEPDIRKSYEPIVGNYGGDRRTTQVRVYVDSNGNPVRASVAKSSGVEGLDDAAVAGVRWTTYKPAQFLCTPVVSQFLMDMEYRP